MADKSANAVRKEAEEINATEAAVKAADEQDVPLAHIEGTGQGGRITASDVNEAAEGQSDLLLVVPADDTTDVVVGPDGREYPKSQNFGELVYLERSAFNELADLKNSNGRPALKVVKHG